MTRQSLIVVAVGVVLAWLAVSVTGSAVLARRAPGIALALWPWSAAAATRQAELIVARYPDVDLGAAGRFAERALRRQPVNAAAARTLSIIAAQTGNVTRSEQFLILAEWLSRRDMPTQLALIESRVQAGNIAGALIHYHRAMQTSVASREILLPVLVRAADDPAIARPLARILAARPFWWQDFYDRYAQTSQNPVAFATVAGALRLSGHGVGEAERAAIAINHLVGLGDVAGALRLYRMIHPQAHAEDIVRDGGFESDTPLPPFEWAYSTDEGSTGIREYRDGAVGRVALSLTGITAGTAARQLLALVPGRYMLTARIGEVNPESGAAPSITLACVGTVDTPGTVLRTATMPTSRGAVRWQIPFDVTMPRCPAQWLTINTGASLDTTRTAPWIDDIRIKPR